MTPSPGAVVRLARLRQELAIDLTALDARVAELDEFLAATTAEQSARNVGIVAAVNIHAWYTALETAFERVARLLDGSVPSGSAWHSELIAQMSVDVPGVRAALIGADLKPDLENIRRFRHFFRNAYVLEFDSTRIRELAAQVSRAHTITRVSFQQLMTHVGAVLESLE
jgi:hypothetical protein